MLERRQEGVRSYNRCYRGRRFSAPPLAGGGGAKEESARVRDHENTNGTPTSPATTSVASPSSPQCFAAHECVTAGSAPHRPNQSRQQPENRERHGGYSARRKLSLLLFFFFFPRQVEDINFLKQYSLPCKSIHTLTILIKNAYSMYCRWLVTNDISTLATKIPSHHYKFLNLYILYVTLNSN